MAISADTMKLLAYLTTGCTNLVIQENNLILEFFCSDGADLVEEKEARMQKMVNCVNAGCTLGREIKGIARSACDCHIAIAKQ